MSHSFAKIGVYIHILINLKKTLPVPQCVSVFSPLSLNLNIRLPILPLLSYIVFLKLANIHISKGEKDMLQFAQNFTWQGTA